MIKTKIFAAAAAVTMLAATSAMAQDISPRGPVYNYGYDYNRNYDSNAAYGDDWDNDRPAYRGGYARYGNGWDRDNTAYRSGYAQRNGFVCEPGTVFINSNGIRTLCQ